MVIAGVVWVDKKFKLTRFIYLGEASLGSWCVLGSEKRELDREQLEELSKTYREMLDRIRVAGFTYDEDPGIAPAQKLFHSVKPLGFAHQEVGFLIEETKGFPGGPRFVYLLSDILVGVGKALDLLDPGWRERGIKKVVLDKKVLNNARLYLANVMLLLESRFVEIGVWLEGVGVRDPKLPVVYRLIRDATYGIEKYLFESET